MGIKQLEKLEKDGFYISAPEGTSMLPMIRAGRDVVKVEKLFRNPERYDLVMYIGNNGQGIIHRVINAYDDYCIICGDNCWRYEHVDNKQIKGIVTSFYRNGVWHDINEKGYKTYVHTWVDFIFVRRVLFNIRDKSRYLIKRVKKGRKN